MDKIENKQYDITEIDVEQLIKFTNIKTSGHLIDMFNNPKHPEGRTVSAFVLQEYELSDEPKTFEEMISYEKLRIYNCKAEIFNMTQNDSEEEFIMTDDDLDCLRSVMNIKDFTTYYYCSIYGRRCAKIKTFIDLEEKIKFLKETRENCDKENKQLMLACIKCEILYHTIKIDEITYLFSNNSI